MVGEVNFFVHSRDSFGNRLIVQKLKSATMLKLSSVFCFPNFCFSPSNRIHKRPLGAKIDGNAEDEENEQ
jgi:hypothetical protein